MWQVSGNNARGFASHLLAYCASEAVAKLSRLAVILVVARTLDPAMIGLAAGAMAASDVLKSLTENGASQRIIAANSQQLEAVCRAAQRIYWVWCMGLFFVQIALALTFWLVSGEALVAMMLAILALEYLFMPGGLVSCALAMREGRLPSTAAISGTQILAANVLTAALALVWVHPLALILPKVLSAPIWLIGMRRLRPWRPDAGVAPAPLGPFLNFGAPILGVEVVKALRLHADKLLIGALLGAEALGIWFFAVNAGLGLSTSLAQAFSVVLFPHLCAARDRTVALARALRLALCCTAPVVVAQALLAPVYVPLLFGATWQGTEDLVAILCLAAIPGILWAAAAQRLRAMDRPGAEFIVTATLTGALVIGTLLVAPIGLEALAWSHLLIASSIQIAAAWPAIAALGLRPAKGA